MKFNLFLSPYRYPSLLRAFLALLLALLFWPGTSRADTDVTFKYEGTGGYTGASDTYVTGQFPNSSLGGLTGLNVGGQQGFAARSLFRFDLSFLKNASFTSISSAKLKLKVAARSGTWSNQAFVLYRVSAANKNWRPGIGVSGSASEDGASCWNYLAYSSVFDLDGNPTHTPWAGSAGLSTATTDYVLTPVATTTLSSTIAVGSEVTWTLTDTSFIADWINTTANNSGFIMRAAGLESSTVQVRFASSEAAASSDRPSFTLSLAGYVAPPSFNITYNLAQASRVSIVIFDANGQVVRELLHAAQRAAGANTEAWDGRDEKGLAVPTGNYTWKLLSSQGIIATYQQSLGTKIPVTYDTWPGNHFPVAAIATDSTGVYLVGGSSEGPPIMIKMDADGNRLWATSYNWVEAWYGGWALSVDSNKIFMMQQNGKVKVFNGTATAPTGAAASWDLLYTPATGPDDPAIDTGAGQMGIMDICARGGKFIVSYKEHNAVRWIDQATGNIIQEVSVTAPTGVTLSPDGNTAYICSQDNKIVKLAYGATTTTVVSTYTAGIVPYRLDWDASTGYLFVAFRGTDNRVRKVNPTNGGTNSIFGGVNNGTRIGGMAQTNYSGVEDIAMAPNGSWWVAEPHTPPFRLARFDPGNAYPAVDFYGGCDYATSSVADPSDPTAIWIDYTREKILVKALVDYTNKTWRPQYLYSYDQPLLPEIMGSWNIINKAGVKYFCRTPGIAVYKLEGGGLVPCAFGGKAMDGGKANWYIPPELRPTNGSKVFGFTWADLNNDGLAQQTEMLYDNSGNRVIAGGFGGNASIDTTLTQYGIFYTVTNNGRGPGKLSPRSWTTGGAPVYYWEDVTYPVDDLPSTLNKSEGVGFARDSSGNTYGAYNTNRDTPTGYGFWSNRTGGNKIVKWKANGDIAWIVGRHSLTSGADPGQMRYLWRVPGVVNDCVFVSDVEQSLVHMYDRDGLYVGRVMDLHGDALPNLAYTLCGENFSGSVFKTSAGDVFYLGGGVNRVLLYKLTGWDTMLRQTGTVTVN